MPSCLFCRSGKRRESTRNEQANQGGAVNYYKRHIGDYAKKAGHLSLLEHGVCTLLLDAYYDREQAPTKAEAIRISRCRTPEELAALEAVLSDFFQLDGDRYVQSRVEEEFVKAEEQAEKNRANGRAGGRPRKPKGNPVGSQSVATGNPDESETKGNPLIHQSTNPQQEQKPVQRAAARFAEFWSVYPVKKGKAAAEKAWRVKGCDAIADSILAHVIRMQAHDDDWRRGYVPHGSTYVNGERWQDEPKHETTNAAPQQQSKTLSAIHMLEGMKHGLADTRDHDRLSEAPLFERGQDPGNGPDPRDRGRLGRGPDG